MITERIFSWPQTHGIVNALNRCSAFLFNSWTLLSKIPHDMPPFYVNSDQRPVWHLPKHLPAAYRPPFCFNLFPSQISLPPLSSFTLSRSHLPSGRHLLMDGYWWYRIAVGFKALESGANGLSNALLWMHAVKREKIGSDLIRESQRQKKKST